MTTFRIGRLDIGIADGRVTLAGRIDEASPVFDLAARIPAGPVTIDTAGVVFINSSGMREWMRLVRELSKRGPITLERVADPLMTQMNLIPEFAERVHIASFHAVYICPACGAEAVPLVDADAHAALLAEMKVPAALCPECGAAMELADFPERYLGIFQR